VHILELFWVNVYLYYNTSTLLVICEPVSGQRILFVLKCHIHAHKKLSDFVPSITRSAHRRVLLLNKRESQFTSGKWLIFLTIALFFIGLFTWTYRFQIGLSEMSAVAILALLSGLIYGFTNANDQRVLRKRYRIDEISESAEWDKEGSGFLKPNEFVVCAGVLGAFFTWGSLPIIYLILQTTTQGLVGNVSSNLSKVASLTFLGLPAYVILGFLSFFSTLAYLSVVRESLLYIAFPTISVTAITMLIGVLCFNDPIVGPEFAIPLLISSMVAYFYSKKVSLEREKERQKFHKDLDSEVERQQDSQHLRLTSLVVFIFIGAEVMRSFIIRNTFIAVPDSSSFFLAICLRTLYFSFFSVCATIWFVLRRCLNGEGIPLYHVLLVARKHAKQIGVVLITSLTFVGAYTTGTPTFACNLVASPLLFAVAQVLIFPLLGAWYFTCGSRPNLKRRLYEVFGRVNGHRRPFRLFIVSYVISLVICVVWIVFQIRV